MIEVEQMFKALKENDIKFYTGVPDSLLKDICGYISDNTNSSEHIIASNEGAAISLAAGYHLATGKISLVYLQNSGLGNCVNPLLSLADKEVYGIPMLIMIGWRGEPGIKDEPQHQKQGRVQNAMLDAMEIEYETINDSTKDIDKVVNRLCNKSIKENRPVALIVSKNTFSSYKFQNVSVTEFEMNREDAIVEIVNSVKKEDVIVSTTGKASRELFEARVRKEQGNQNDFLTVGSMGHSNQIALGIALNTNKRVICIDGDGAILMHLGSLAIIGNSKVSDLIHIAINNGAHDSVGGQPTVGFDVNFVEIARACGYDFAYSIDKKEEVNKIINKHSKNGSVFIEIKVNKGARKELGRPTSSPVENKQALMKLLSE